MRLRQFAALVLLVTGCDTTSASDDVGGDVNVTPPNDSGVADSSLPSDSGDSSIDAGCDACTSNTFVHPGILVGKSQLDFVKGKVAASAAPWAAAFTKVSTNPYASLSYTPNPVTTLDSTDTSTADIESDQIAAYSDALIYYYTGNAAYADKAITIINAWSAVLTTVHTNAQLHAAWVSEVFPRAAEIIRYTYSPANGHPTLDLQAFTTMLTTVILPQLSATSNGSTYSNGNWELSMADGTMNIGIFTDDHATFDQGVAMWRARVPAYIYETSDGANPVTPPGNIYDSAAKLKCFWTNASSVTSTCTLPSNFTYLNGMCQETCRDESHVILGFEAMTNGAETARLQGVDLYGEEKQRIVDGYEFAAQYDLEANSNLAGDGLSGAVPADLCGGSLVLGGTGYKLGFEEAYNEYATRLGVSMPYTLQMINKLRPTPAALHIDWETLTFVGTP